MFSGVAVNQRSWRVSSVAVIGVPLAPEAGEPSRWRSVHRTAHSCSYVDLWLVRGGLLRLHATKHRPTIFNERSGCRNVAVNVALRAGKVFVAKEHRNRTLPRAKSSVSGARRVP
jgi:hypothetical protein